MIDVLLMDRHHLVRQAIGRVLAETPDIRVAEMVASEREALRRIAEQPPTVVLKAITVSGGDSLRVLRRLLEARPMLRILVLGNQFTAMEAARFLEAGVLGCLNKSAEPSELVAGVRAVAIGRSFLCTKLTQLLALASVDGDAARPFAQLSARETEVMEQLVKGASMREIAERLGVSPKTVSTYRYRIWEKTGVDSDVALTRLALRSCLFDAEDG
jgi:two-component system invasion response regulator UvrY